MSAGEKQKRSDMVFEEISGMAAPEEPRPGSSGAPAHERADADSIDITRLASEIDSLTGVSGSAKPSAPDATRAAEAVASPDRSHAAAPVKGGFAESFFYSDILNSDRDFVVLGVHGVGDANENNLFQYINARLQDPALMAALSAPKADVRSAEVVAAPSSVSAEAFSPDAIGYEVISITDMPDEVYRSIFNAGGDDVSLEDDDQNLSGDYELVDTGREQFVDLDLIFGLPGGGDYSRGADGSPRSGHAPPLNMSPGKVSAKNPRVAQSEEFDPAVIKVEIPAEDDQTLTDPFVLHPVDLREAEKIASEEILFLSEDDLIEELESIDLTPVEEAPPAPAVAAESKLRVEFFNRLGQMADEEIADIESDISAERALIIEERVDDIRQELSAARLAEDRTRPKPVEDITSRIVILEDEESVHAALSRIDVTKKEDMKRLLHYLDGLFEKLPEDTVKRFAESEYFDLYVSVMNDLEA